jgi:hypothetical protein
MVLKKSHYCLFFHVCVSHYKCFVCVAGELLSLPSLIPSCQIAIYVEHAAKDKTVFAYN